MIFTFGSRCVMNFFLNLGIAMGLKSFVEPLQQLTMMEVNIWERAHRLNTRRLIWILASHSCWICQLNQYTYKYYDGNAVYKYLSISR